jgi:hypothetical protein
MNNELERTGKEAFVASFGALSGDTEENAPLGIVS